MIFAVALSRIRIAGEMVSNTSEYGIGWEEGAVPNNFQNTHRIPKNPSFG